MKEKKIDIIRLIIGIIPFIGVFIFAFGLAGFCLDVSCDKPTFSEIIYIFFKLCGKWWPITLFGLLFIVLSFFPKKGKAKNKKIKKQTE